MFYDRTVRVGVFPTGIEPQKFTQGLEKPEAKVRVAAPWLSIIETRKIIIGVDRIDYIKGIPPKLKALELFLDKHPEWIGKLVLIQVAIPSREDVKEYRELASNLHRWVD